MITLLVLNEYLGMNITVVVHHTPRRGSKARESSFICGDKLTLFAVKHSSEFVCIV